MNLDEYSQEEINNLLIHACRQGKLQKIEYLLTHPELKDKIDIELEEGACLEQACLAGRLKVVKYLLTSPDLKKNADIHGKSDNPFKYAASQGHLEVIKFLIFEMNIEKSKEIDIYLKKIDDVVIQNMFELRELNKDLNSNLIDKNTIKTKVKL